MDTPAEKNITRALEALSPYINNPRKTVIRIEAFVALAAALLFLQFILGGWRRRSGNWLVQGTLWLCYTSSFPLIAYTIGLMASSPVKNGLYPLWATLLFWVSGGTDSVKAYALEDNKQWKRYLFELLQYYVYAIFILVLLGDKSSTSSFPHVVLSLLLLVGVLFAANLFRVMASWMVANSSPSRVVADYMQAIVGDQGTFDGRIYLVRYYAIGVIPNVPSYTTKLSIDDIITVYTIWEESNDFDDNKKGGGLPWTWKDVCLSFALSELLKRRFYGMECAEANLPETRDFVLKGLLTQDDEANNNGYKRAFQIIEVELGFLYDFFFTKYAVLAELGMTIVLVMAVVKFISISICGAFLLRGSFTIETSKPVIEVGTATVDVTITVMIIGALFLVEVVQVILFVASDWATVSLACRYTRSGNRLRKKIILFVISCLGRFNLSRTKFGKFLHRLNLFRYWQNKIGQSSIIERCLHAKSGPVDYVTFFKITPYLIDLCVSVMYPGKTFLVVPDLVKSEIVSALEKHCKRGGPLTNGKAALDRGGANFGEFAWTLSKHHHSQTMVMLIWHIATEYCSIASPRPSEADHPHKDVAITLSRYCAYLMSFLPDLLPGNSTDTDFVNHAVLQEARFFLHGNGPITKEILLEAIELYTMINRPSRNTTDQASTSNNNNEVTDKIFIKGLRLGRDLEDKGADHWELLAEFWAETIIFIAPSDNATAHMERLAQGGEFLTHIWALLNHAGILTRDHAGDIP